MKKKKLLLTFEGVETAFHCWINGHYVGYGEDSYTPSVFEITPFVENGENKIAVEVSRFPLGAGWKIRISGGLEGSCGMYLSLRFRGFTFGIWR